MEELRKIAMAYYQASPDNIQTLAHNFFNAMDNDCDGKIDLHEFLAFMKEEGYTQMTNSFFFKKLDLDRNGTLDFWEVMTLYYIVKSGRPFCNRCRGFIPGTYFTCVACVEGTFNLCLDCYLSQKCDHTHQGISHFMDNYSLLVAKFRSTMNQSQSLDAKSRPPMVIVPSTTSVPSSLTTTSVSSPNTAPNIVYNNTWIHNVNTYTSTPSNSLQYPIAEWKKRKIALGALDAAISIGAIGATISSCTIL